MICEKCGKEHDGSYGSGRFCSAFCARSFSGSNRSEESRNKTSKSLRTYYLEHPEEVKKVQQSKRGKFKGRKISEETRSKIKNAFFKKQLEWEEKWLSGEISGYYETNHWGDVPDRIKAYLRRVNDNKCCLCGWSKVNPHTGKVPLEVDHIDGNHKNNRPENLRLICPNCHALTENYRGANRGKGRKKTWKLIEE